MKRKNNHHLIPRNEEQESTDDSSPAISRENSNESVDVKGAVEDNDDNVCDNSLEDPAENGVDGLEGGAVGPEDGADVPEDQLEGGAVGPSTPRTFISTL